MTHKSSHFYHKFIRLHRSYQPYVDLVIIVPSASVIIDIGKLPATPESFVQIKW